jgi:hypothetical protein
MKVVQDYSFVQLLQEQQQSPFYQQQQRIVHQGWIGPSPVYPHYGF